MRSTRELDKALARALGLSVIETDDCNGQDNLWIDPVNFKELPFYSTDWRAAMALVEEVRAISVYDVFSLMGPSDESKLWFAGFERKWHGRGFTDVYDRMAGDTGPEAICLAALDALAPIAPPPEAA